MVMLYNDPKDETINSSSAVTDSAHQTENVKDSSELSLRINEINKLKSDIAALKVDVKFSLCSSSQYDNSKLYSFVGATLTACSVLSP